MQTFFNIAATVIFLLLGLWWSGKDTINSITKIVFFLIGVFGLIVTIISLLK
jgi:hypothetical protein